MVGNKSCRLCSETRDPTPVALLSFWRMREPLWGRRAHAQRGSWVIQDPPSRWAQSQRLLAGTLWKWPLSRPRTVPWYISSLSKASAFYFWQPQQPVPHLTTRTWTLGSLAGRGERREWPPSPAGAAPTLRERKTRGSRRPGKKRQ